MIILFFKNVMNTQRYVKIEHFTITIKDFFIKNILLAFLPFIGYFKIAFKILKPKRNLRICIYRSCFLLRKIPRLTIFFRCRYFKITFQISKS